jgi:PEGA domain
VGAENVNPHQELTKLDEQIKSAADLAALKPIFTRLNEIVQAFPDDFDVQLTGNEIKQRLMARGTELRQEQTFASPTPVPPTSPNLLDTRTTFAPPPPPTPTPAPPKEPSVAGESKPPSSGSISKPPSTSSIKPPSSAPFIPPTPPLPSTMSGVIRTSAAQKKPAGWNRTVLTVPAVGLLVALVCILWATYETRKRAKDEAARKVAAVAVDITTMPAGASVTVNADPPPAGAAPVTCKSNCKLSLPPGKYQLSASLDGFDTTAGAFQVTSRQPTAVSLTFQPAAQSLRLLTDLTAGKVIVDGAPPADLQEGQFVLDKVSRGPHTVKVTGPNSEASFSFEIADAHMPVVGGPVTARNVVAVLVSSFGKQAHITTNGGPWKLAVNGQPQTDVSPAGTDATGFQPGVNEIVLGEGKDQRNMSETFGAAPMLTAFLKSDVNAGTLIVSASPEDVRVFLNDKEYKRHTERGQLRIQTLGKVTVKVAKSGFQDEPPQSVEVKKGAEVRLQFNLKPQPQFGSLVIHGGQAGAEVLVDQKAAGTVQADGSFSVGAISPGDHNIELRRDQFMPKRLQRSFKAGQATVLAAADVAMAPATGVVRITVRNPAALTVSYKRGDEAEPHEARGNQMDLPAGSYIFTGSAPGFTEASVRVPLGAGESHDVAFNLVREGPASPPPPSGGGMSDFEDAQSWKKDGDNWTHKGGGFVPYKLGPKGTYTFTVQLLKGGGVFRAGQIRWCVQYIDSKNYLLSEMDRKNFWAGVIQKGQRLERVKIPTNLGNNQKAFTIQVEVSADKLVQRLKVGDEWKVIDTFSEPGRDFTQGKFGFLIQGNDEIAISDFKFDPK